MSRPMSVKTGGGVKRGAGTLYWSLTRVAFNLSFLLSVAPMRLYTDLSWTFHCSLPTKNFSLLFRLFRHRIHPAMEPTILTGLMRIYPHTPNPPCSHNSVSTEGTYDLGSSPRFIPSKQGWINLRHWKRHLERDGQHLPCTLAKRSTYNCHTERLMEGFRIATPASSPFTGLNAKPDAATYEPAGSQPRLPSGYIPITLCLSLFAGGDIGCHSCCHQIWIGILKAE
ncbi:hypothetical protein FIBSPDRAFT_399135 [Athelia psychrophila]|uniref:Uncharacterized protein n=1 Tax=Athelia psychrophila TaxID=1759441 RepID=A0A166NEG3_9AGAM|nr:hypothetical protein FIBSPDRAFT_399135 [Fibularhizoctonia sp. CBS 109695]